MSTGDQYDEPYHEMALRNIVRTTDEAARAKDAEIARLTAERDEARAALARHIDGHDADCSAAINAWKYVCDCPKGLAKAISGGAK